MEATRETPTAELKEEVKESREVRRMRERINEDANKTFVALAEKYRTCFMENDPNSEEVNNMRRQVCAKWRVYCKNRNLIPEAYTQVDTFCAELMADYTTTYTDLDLPKSDA